MSTASAAERAEWEGRLAAEAAQRKQLEEKLTELRAQLASPQSCEEDGQDGASAPPPRAPPDGSPPAPLRGGETSGGGASK